PRRWDSGAARARRGSAARSAPSRRDSSASASAGRNSAWRERTPIRIRTAGVSGLFDSLSWFRIHCCRRWLEFSLPHPVFEQIGPYLEMHRITYGKSSAPRPAGLLEIIRETSHSWPSVAHRRLPLWKKLAVKRQVDRRPEGVR